VYFNKVYFYTKIPYCHLKSYDLGEFWKYYLFFLILLGEFLFPPYPEGATQKKFLLMIKLDNTDRAILDLLQKDAKQTNKEIAGKMDLTTTPIYERIKRLEKKGIIQKYIALVDRQKVGLSMLAFCNVSLKEHTKAFLYKFKKDVLSLEEVVECYHIAGNYDYLLKVVVEDMDTYQRFVAQKLAALENIGRVQSNFVMMEIKHSTALPIGSTAFSEK
jgi:Lrp/AsnC family leucine-responsive transcriptional regulator